MAISFSNVDCETDDELSSEESDDGEENEHVDIVTQTKKKSPPKEIKIITESTPRSKQRGNIDVDFQDTSIVETAKGDYSGTQTQTIRFDHDENNDENENDSENDSDMGMAVKRSKETQSKKRGKRNLSKTDVKKTNVGREPLKGRPKPSGPIAHEELRERIKLAGVAIAGLGKIEGPTSQACTLL